MPLFIRNPGDGETTRAAVLREADAIRGLDILTDATPEDQRAVLRQAVRDYVERTSRRDLLDKVLDEELPRYAEALRRLGE